MKQHKIAPLALVIGLAVALLTLFDLILPTRTFSDMENRVLSPLPSFSFKTFLNGRFASDYEEYLNDQFVGRDLWINLKSLGEKALFKTENNGIVYGKDHYLFENYPAYPNGQYEENIASLANFLPKAAGLSHVTVGMVPSSYVLLKDKLPAGLHNVDQQAIWEESVRTTLAPVKDCFDELPVLAILQEHPEYQLYYYTDHHWTGTGAHLVYEEYMTRLGKTPVRLEEESFTYSDAFYGSYYSKAKNVDAVADVIQLPQIAVKEVLVNGEERNGYLDPVKLEERDKYAAFLYGNNGMTRMLSAEADTGKILLIKDSFGNCFAPYLLHDFSQVDVVDLRTYPGSLSQLMEEERYDEVLVLYNFMIFAEETDFYRIEE